MHYDIVRYAAFLRFTVDEGHRFEHRWRDLRWRREAKGPYPQRELGKPGHVYTLELLPPLYAAAQCVASISDCGLLMVRVGSACLDVVL